MSFDYNNSSYIHGDKPKPWATEDYLSEMRSRLCKLRALQPERSDIDNCDKLLDC